MPIKIRDIICHMPTFTQNYTHIYCSHKREILNHLAQRKHEKWRSQIWILMLFAGRSRSSIYNASELGTCTLSNIIRAPNEVRIPFCASRIFRQYSFSERIAKWFSFLLFSFWFKCGQQYGCDCYEQWRFPSLSIEKFRCVTILSMGSHLPSFLIRLTNIRIPLLRQRRCSIRSRAVACVQSWNKTEKKFYDPNVLFSFSLFFNHL